MPKGVKKTNTGYMGNPDLPSKGTVYEYTAEMVSEIQKCKEDILYFAENYFYILNIDEGKKKKGDYQQPSYSAIFARAQVNTPPQPHFPTDDKTHLSMQPRMQSAMQTNI